MAIRTQIIDSFGTSKGLKINGEGEIGVVVHTHPPIEEDVAAIPFRQYFIDDNDSNDMTINGLSSPTNFSIKAVQDFDIYVKSISVNIGDNGSPALNKFGAITALANGVEWTYHNQKTGDLILHEGLQTNLDFIRIGIDTAAVGDGVTAFLADTSGGGTEKNYLPFIDMGETFGMPFGVRLVKGTNDQITFKIRDDLSSLITFDAIAYGIKV